MNKKKKILFLTIIIAALFVFSTVGYVFIKSAQASTIQEYIELGLMHENDGNYQQALIAYQQVLIIDKRHVEARVGLSKALVNLDRKSEAVSILKEGTKLLPKESIFYKDLSTIYLSENKIEHAIYLLTDGIDRTRNQALKDQLAQIESEIEIVSEYQILQVGHQTVVQLVYQGNRTLEVEEWKNTAGHVNINFPTNTEVNIEPHRTGIDVVVAKIGSVERSISLDIREQALKTIEIDLHPKKPSVGDTIKLLATGYDFDGKKMEIYPLWMYEGQLGELKNERGNINHFIATEKGIVEITAEDEGVKSSISLLVDVEKYELITTIIGNGHIIEQKVLSENDYVVVTIEAVPDVGWEFERWEGDVVGSDIKVELVLSANKNVRAIFVEQQTIVQEVTVQTENTNSQPRPETQLIQQPKKETQPTQKPREPQENTQQPEKPKDETPKKESPQQSEEKPKTEQPPRQEEKIEEKEPVQEEPVTITIPNPVTVQPDTEEN